MGKQYIVCEKTCLVVFGHIYLFPFKAVALKSLFKVHSNFIISVLCLGDSTLFHLFIYGDVAFLTGSSCLLFTYLPCKSNTPPPFFHPCMHPYRGWIRAVHVLTMCSTSLLPDLSLLPLSVTIFFSSPWCLSLLLNEPTPNRHARTKARTACFTSPCFIFFFCTVMVSVGLYAPARHGVSKTADTFLSYRFDWLRFLWFTEGCIRPRGAQSKTVTMRRMYINVNHQCIISLPLQPVLYAYI